MKIIIDNHRDRYGSCIMTGSQQFSLMEQVSESLTGRIALLRLETLSAMELRQTQVPDPDRFLYRGLAADVGVSDVTIKKWIHALEISGLIYLLPPFYANIGKRLVKSPKLYFGDHGLLCHLLGIDSEAKWHDHPHKGNLWENLVMMELIKTLDLQPGTDLFFYRDQNGVEIDFLIEKNNRLILVEAKAGERVTLEKLHFDRVAPLLGRRFPLVTNMLALNMPGNDILTRKQFVCFNPMYASAADASETQSSA